MINKRMFCTQNGGIHAHVHHFQLQIVIIGYIACVCVCVFTYSVNDDILVLFFGQFKEILL